MNDLSSNPYILTLSIEEKAVAFFNQQRLAYFPPEKNFLQAHLTLFHYLPLDADTIITQIRAIAATQSYFTVEAKDVASIGKGVAYKLESAQLQTLHKQLQQLWKPILKPQDLQKLWPHITIQNRVESEEAKALLAELKPNFAPFHFEATGLSLWEYLNGPWRFVETINFSAQTHP